MCTKPVALTIAGFDPGSGAGVTADLKTFSAHRVYGVACISALTVQSTQGVRAVEPLSAALVRQTLDCLAEDVGLSGVKIGMLATSGIVSEVVSFLTGESARLDRSRIVLDPVLRSTSGTPLLDANGVHLLRDRLLHCIGWITPNIRELAILIGEDPGGRDQVPATAVRLKRDCRAARQRRVERGGHWRRSQQPRRLSPHRLRGAALVHRGKNRHQFDPRNWLCFLERTPLRTHIGGDRNGSGGGGQVIRHRSIAFRLPRRKREGADEPPLPI